MTREEKVEALVTRDIKVIKGAILQEDHIYLNEILRGEGWVQYNNMTDPQIDAEYEELKALEED